MHILNPTARRIWELCDGEHSVEDMAQAIRGSFSVPDAYDVGQVCIAMAQLSMAGVLRYYLHGARAKPENRKG
jgi:hypothetical protein